MPDPIAFIDATGIHAPSYADVLTYIQTGMRGIYGQDLYLENDSQDGQLAALFAKAIHDSNSAMVSTYNAFSPATAIGTGLSSVVKINGIARLVPTSSTVDLVITGTGGTIITNGIATDAAQNRWLLPPTVIIDPILASVRVTATASAPGAINGPTGSINKILTPTRGWLTVTNPGPAIVGLPVEGDADLRRRQTLSTTLPALSTSDALTAALLSIPGVTRLRVYENTTRQTDSNGIPGNSVATIIDGGDAGQIAGNLLLKKGQGAGTYGPVAIQVVDPYGVTKVMNFGRPIAVPVAVNVLVRSLFGYTTVVGTAILDAIYAYAQTNLSKIGQDVYVTQFFVPANLSAGSGGGTYDVLTLTITRLDLPSDAYGNVPIAYNEAPIYDRSNFTLTAIP